MDIVHGNAVAAAVNAAVLSAVKAADKFIAYPGSIITYHIAVVNSGDLPALDVVITDPLPGGTTYVPGSLTVSVPYTGDPTGAITLTGPVAPGQTVAVSFRVAVGAAVNPNPIRNQATVNYAYLPGLDIVVASTVSNTVSTVFLRNDYSQQVSDLIESVALEQAALAAIANAEGAKIQRFAAMPGVTTEMLLCLNKSVADMTDSIAMLEAILKKKLSTVGCQIDGGCAL